MAVLGLSYKPDTWVIERSQGVELAQKLAESGAQVVVHDPQALDPARAVLGSSVEYADTLESAIAEADVIVIATPWRDYKALHADIRPNRDIRVFDCWDFVDAAAFEELPQAELIRIGRHHPNSIKRSDQAISSVG